MKVLHIIGGGDVGGAKTHILSLVKELATCIDVTLVSLREGPFSEDAKKEGIHTIVFGKSNPFFIWRKIHKLILSEGYDLVHCHGGKANVVGAFLRFFCRHTVVTTMHSDYRLDYLGNRFKQWTNGLLNTVSLRFLSGYVAVSERMQRTLISRKFDPQKVYAIYNGIDYSLQPKVAMGRTGYFDSLGFPVADDNVVFGIAARLTEIKDLPTLFKAFALVLSKNDKVRLCIAGTGEDTDKLKKLAVELGISEAVCFAGWVTDMDTYYAAIDVNLLTSLSETFPYAVSMAVRSGLPCICSDVGGMAELIDSGYNGFIFQPRDVDTLAERMLTLSLDSDLRRVFARRLLDKASKHFSIGQMRDTQIAIYSRFIGRAKGRRKKVLICGAYGRGNAGDDAILEAILQELFSLDDDLNVIVMSRNPLQTKCTVHVGSIHIFNIFAFARHLFGAKLFINGGGTLLQDATSTRSLVYYLFTLRLAKFFGVKVMAYGCGVGPISHKKNRKRTGKVLNRTADVISLRDQLSVDELADMQVVRPKIIQSADPTLSLVPSDVELLLPALLEEGYDDSKKYICFALRNWSGFDEKVSDIASMATYAYETCSLIPAFFPMEYPKDISALKKVRDKLPCPSLLFEKQYLAKDVIAILSKMQVVVGIRLHSLVFATGQGVPVVGLSYDKKVSSFMEYMNIDLCIDLADCTAERLCALVDRAVLQQGTRETLLENARRLRELEQRNLQGARELLGL